MALYSYTYSLPYLLFMCYLFVLMAWEFRLMNRGESKHRVQIMTMAGVLFFIGARGLICTDWYVYYTMFQEAPTLFSPNVGDIFKSDYVEKGYYLFMCLTKTIVPNYFFFTFVCTLIDVLLFHYVIKRYSRYYVIAFIAFFIFQGLIIEVNLLRNAKAIFLFMFSLHYIEERRPWPFFLINLLGVTFHTSALLFLPLYFFLHRKISKPALITIFAVGNVIFLMQLKFIVPLFGFVGEFIGGRTMELVSKYMLFVSDTQSYGLSIGFFERLLTCGLIVGFYDKLIKQSAANRLFINSWVLYFVIFYATTEVAVVAGRLAYLFIFSYWFLYPNMIKATMIRSNKIIFIILFSTFTVLKVVDITNYFIYKYDNVIFGAEDYRTRASRFDRFYNEDS